MRIEPLRRTGEAVGVRTSRQPQLVDSERPSLRTPDGWVRTVAT